MTDGDSGCGWENADEKTQIEKCGRNKNLKIITRKNVYINILDI